MEFSEKSTVQGWERARATRELDKSKLILSHLLYNVLEWTLGRMI